MGVSVVRFINYKDVIWAFKGEVLSVGEKRMVLCYDGEKSETVWISAWYDPSVDRIYRGKR
jgi:hypothetical protein